MEDEKDKIVKLEERLEKAAATFKDMKVQLEEKEKENESLRSRISDLEDELTINGGAKEEVENLKGRLEKAKEIFTSQKAKIAELTEANAMKSTRIDELEEHVNEIADENKTLQEERDGLNDTINQIREILNA